MNFLFLVLVLSTLIEKVSCSPLSLTLEHEIDLNKWFKGLSTDCHTHIITYKNMTFAPFEFPISFQDVVFKPPRKNDSWYTEEILGRDTVMYPEAFFCSLKSGDKVIHFEGKIKCIHFVFLMKNYDKAFHNPRDHKGLNHGPFAIPNHLKYFWRGWRKGKTNEMLGLEADERVDRLGTMFSLVSIYEKDAVKAWVNKLLHVYFEMMPNKIITVYPLILIEDKYEVEGVSMVCLHCVKREILLLPLGEINHTFQNIRQFNSALNKWIGLWFVIRKQYGEFGWFFVNKIDPECSRCLTPWKYEVRDLDEILLRTVMSNKSVKFIPDLSQSGQLMPSVYLSGEVYIALPMKRSSFEFLTCDGKAGIAQDSGFLTLLSPFNAYIWAWMIVTAVIAAGVLNLSLMKKRRDPDAIMMIYSTILEHGHDSALNPTKLRQGYLILAPWLLLFTIIMPTAYKGIVTTELTLPSKVELVKTYGDIVAKNFTLFMRPSYKLESPIEIHRLEKKEYFATILFYEYIAIAEQNFYIANKSAITSELFNEVRGIMRIPKDGDWNKPTYLPLIMDCDKTAIADWSDIIDIQYRQLKTVFGKKRHVAKGEQSLWNQTFGWSFVNMIDPKIRPNIKTIQEAGIVMFWQQLDEQLRFLRGLRNLTIEEESSSVKEIEIVDKIRFVFFLLLICLALCLISFVVEYLILKFESVWRFVLCAVHWLHNIWDLMQSGFRSLWNKRTLQSFSFRRTFLHFKARIGIWCKRKLQL